MEKVIKAELAKGFSTASDKDFDTLSTLSARQNGQNKYDMRDRQSHDIFGWSNYQEEKPKLGKKRAEAHIAS
jgi:hypothetical protein